MTDRKDFEKLDFRQHSTQPFDPEAGVPEESTPVNRFGVRMEDSVVLDMDPLDSSDEASLDAQYVELVQFVPPVNQPMKESRSNSLRSDNSSRLEVIEESPQVSPEESPKTSSENSPLEVTPTSPQPPPEDMGVPMYPVQVPADRADSSSMSVKSISPSNSLFSSRQTPDSDQQGKETESDNETQTKTPNPPPGYADFDPSLFTKMFPIPDKTTETNSPRLVAVRSIASVPEESSGDEEEKDQENNSPYISPIPTPETRRSVHQGSLLELQARRLAKQREKLRSGSGSPADPETDHHVSRVSRISESHSPGHPAPRRLSLDVPELSHSMKRSPSCSPLSSPVRSTLVSESLHSSPLPDQPLSAMSTMEDMFASPAARRRLSTQVRRSKAFASFFGSKSGDEEEQSPVMKSRSRRKSLAHPMTVSRKRSSEVSNPKQKRRSTLTKIADAVVSAFIKRSAEPEESANNSKRERQPKKEKVAQSIINRQISQPIETPSFMIDELSPEQEEAVIQPLPAQIIPPPLVRMGRGRRNSIMPGAEAPQVVMRKMDTKKKERPGSSHDGPKIDDVVFTVNTKGEMEMFEVVPVAQPTVPTGKKACFSCPADCANW